MFTDDEGMFSLVDKREVHSWSSAYDFRTLITVPMQCGGKTDLEARMHHHLRKATRLRLYIGTLLGYGLEGVHNYDPDDVDRVMQQDLALANNIGCCFLCRKFCALCVFRFFD